MSLQFILGRAGDDHELVIAHQLMHDYRQNPHAHYFYLVPNHVKFKSEIGMLDRLNLESKSVYAQINVQILSLTRLGWYFLNQRPHHSYQQLDDSGVNMLIYQIIRDHHDDLILFQTEADQPGFVLKLAQQINEMQTSQISADDLARIAKNSKDWDADLRQKTHDFIVIYRAFERATYHKYISKAGVLERLCENLRHRDLSHDYFYVSGFAHFTAQEAELIRLLICHSARVVIDLKLNHPAVQFPKRDDLFYQPARLYYRLYHFARNQHVPIRFDLKTRHCRISPGLRKFEDYWIASRGQGKIQHADSETKKLVQNSVQIIQADNHYAELAQVATKIRQMVATGKYRYSDFLILTRHLDKFQNVIKPIFQLQHIPIFNDLEKQMVAHPLVQLIEALFSIDGPNVKQSYRYSDVMKLLKTELLIPKIADHKLMPIHKYRNDLALCENLALKNGYQGSRWTQDQDWQFSRFNNFKHQTTVDKKNSKRVNVIRHFVKDTLPPFYRQLRKATNGRAAVQILYRFLVDHGVVDRLKRWRRNDLRLNRLAEAGQSSQVWSVFCNLLDNFVEILGDQPFHLNDFWALLKAGFEATSYSQIPPAFDQVVISESKIVQTNDYRVVFMIGSTDDVMPDQITNDSLFNDSDRNVMASQIKKTFAATKYLNDNSEYQMANEPYLNYLAFMSATQQLIFTYSLGNLTGDDADSGINVSPYVAQIQSHFHIQVHRPNLHPIADQDEILPYVGSWRATLKHLVQAIHDQRKNHRSLSSAWQFVKKTLSNHHPELTAKLLDSVNYRNVPQKLTPRHAIELYGNDIEVSISQLENFYADPYEYFLKYGLRLKPRDVFQLQPAQTGLFYHESLDHLVKYLRTHDLDVASVSPERLNRIVEHVTNQILTDPQETRYRILNSSARMNYVKSQLVRTVKEMAASMHFQGYYTPMRPRSTEIAFNDSDQQPGQHLAPLKFTINHKQPHRLLVQGRIDRIDTMNVNHQNYLGIVDYKSSPHAFDFGQIMTGTQLQMLTYLDVLNRNLARLYPGGRNHLSGALYSLIHLPQLSVKDLERSRSLHLATLGQHRYNGILVKDRQLLNSIDRSLKLSSRSLVYPLKLKKNGDLNRRSQRMLVTLDDLKLMLKWTEHLIVTAGKRIYSGDDRISPVRLNRNWTQLQYSPYRSIMQFDPLLTENNYHEVGRMTLPELIKRIKKESDS